MISIGQIEVSNLPAKPCGFGPKMKRNLKTFKKILRFFDQNLYGKLTFSQFYTKYLLDFWLLSESIDLWKITPDFYNNFSDFGGGDVPAFPPPSRRYWTEFKEFTMTVKNRMEVYIIYLKTDGNH